MSRFIYSIIVLLVSAVAAHAHHGSAPFDTDTEIIIEGVITEFDYRNPHSFVYLRTVDADGNPRDVAIESVGSSLRPYGVTRESLAPGDRVIAVVNPSRREPDTWGPLPEPTLSQRLSYVPKLERGVIAEAGHFMHIEQPEAVARIVLDWLDAG